MANKPPYGKRHRVAFIKNKLRNGVGRAILETETTMYFQKEDYIYGKETVSFPYG